MQSYRGGIRNTAERYFIIVIKRAGVQERKEIVQDPRDMVGCSDGDKDSNRVVNASGEEELNAREHCTTTEIYQRLRNA